MAELRDTIISRVGTVGVDGGDAVSALAYEGLVVRGYSGGGRGDRWGSVAVRTAPSRP